MDIENFDTFLSWTWSSLRVYASTKWGYSDFAGQWHIWAERKYSKLILLKYSIEIDLIEIVDKYEVQYNISRPSSSNFLPRSNESFGWPTVRGLAFQVSVTAEHCSTCQKACITQEDSVAWTVFGQTHGPTATMMKSVEKKCKDFLYPFYSRFQMQWHWHLFFDRCDVMMCHSKNGKSVLSCTCYK